MYISTEEKRVIDSLVCERLSASDQNLRLVDGFFNRRNDSLATVIKNEAFADDESGRMAYYVVKSGSGEILMFFSLKTGLLYDQHIDEKSIKMFKKLNDFVQDAISQPNMTEEQAKALADLLEKIRTHKGISKADLDRLPNKNKSIYEELEAELNANITHVGKTYSGIELVHFCRNNEYDEVLKGLGLTRKFGEIVFWHFLVPKILEARKLIGIEYLFLFAADMTQDNLLVKYYNKLLKFKLDEERATVKPVYDFSCKFMYQPIDGMEDAMSAFWANYMTDDEV